DRAGEHLRALERRARLVGQRAQVLGRRRGMGLAVGLDVLGDDHGRGGLSGPRPRRSATLLIAVVNSEGMTKTLLASPWASWGSMRRYWYCRSLSSGSPSWIARKTVSIAFDSPSARRIAA